MIWARSNRRDQLSRVIADRHYNRQTVGSPHFVPPGRCIVLRAIDNSALWVTSWPFAEYVLHAWAGAWVNSLFRNEGTTLSSELIRQAVAATRAVALETESWEGGRIPELGMITFIDAKKTRRKRDPGRCYRKAGFVRARCPKHDVPLSNCPACRGFTAGGLVALQLMPDAMPPPESPIEQCSKGVA